MKIVLASGNNGKIKEFKELFPNDEIIAYKDILGDFNIIEDGNSFAENAIIKSEAIFNKLKLKDENIIVVSDDSGITIKALNNEPGIFSARYAGQNATSEENLNKVISELNKKNIKKSKAFYTAAIAITSKYGTSVVHGWMHGDVINKKIGNNGFGYDPIFIPDGYDKTLGELNNDIKKLISHRSQAIYLAKLLLLEKTLH